jgi:spermidine synthase
MTQVFATTLILSAFLLFSIQPLFARLLLPLLGGTPSVWAVSMVFFQGMLLLGYAYAHGTSRYLSVRAQALVHLALLALCALALPPGLGAGVTPSSTDPTLWQLGTMAAHIGGPFLVVAASAPMIQRWFTHAGQADSKNPYILYAASNIGSLAALLSYPVLVEPFLTLNGQTFGWALGYGVLMALTLCCALAVWKNPAAVRSPVHHPVSTPSPTWARRLSWLLLAAIPSSLLLGVTTFITTDIASAPLLWIVPLVLYLATFIIVFARRQVIGNNGIFVGFNVAFAFAVFFTISGLFQGNWTLFGVHLLLFFFAALLCHKRLADMRPDPAHLTEYYLVMSLGGVLGGAANALLAPVVFVVPFEYTLALCLVLFVRGVYAGGYRFLYRDWADNVFTAPVFLGALTVGLLLAGWFTDTLLAQFPILPAITAALALMGLRLYPLGYAVFGAAFLVLSSPVMSLIKNPPLMVERNYFGVMRVIDQPALDLRQLYHGTTLHGAQSTRDDYKTLPITYYHPTGGAGDIFRVLDDRRAGPQRIAVIGLGTGAMACYWRADRHFDFYEIDPDIAAIAQNPTLFSYLQDCGSPYDIIIGDGRLEIAKAAEGKYDAIIIDAFSSDNIPIHLLTLEAMRIYMHKVKADGMIAFHLSNRYMNLEPQIAALSMETRVPAILRLAPSHPIHEGTTTRSATSFYAVMTSNPDILLNLQSRDRWTPAQRSPHFRLWTDDYANILSAFGTHRPAATP